MRRSETTSGDLCLRTWRSESLLEAIYDCRAVVGNLWNTVKGTKPCNSRTSLNISIYALEIQNSIYFFLIKLNLKKSTTNLFHFSLFSTISFEEVPFLVEQICSETGFLFFSSGRAMKLYMDGSPDSIIVFIDAASPPNVR